MAWTGSIWRWATCSEGRARLAGSILLALPGLIAGAPCAHAKVIVAPETAVREAFPEAVTTRRVAYLSEIQARKVRAEAGSPPSSKIVVSWEATREERYQGTAYLETHTVRTLPESLLVVVGPYGSVRKVEVLSFDEPAEYLPRPRWLAQFEGRRLDSELSLRSGVRGITGATLTSRAVTAAVRRVLAIHSILRAEGRAGETEGHPGTPPIEPAKPRPPGSPDRADRVELPR